MDRLIHLKKKHAIRRTARCSERRLGERRHVDPRRQDGFSGTKKETPRQMIAFLGHHLDKKLLQAELETLLLNDEEMMKLKRAMARPWPADGSPRDETFEDPFVSFGDINEAIRDFTEEQNGDCNHNHDEEDDAEWETIKPPPPRYFQKLPPVFDEFDIGGKAPSSKSAAKITGGKANR